MSLLKGWWFWILVILIIVGVLIYFDKIPIFYSCIELRGASSVVKQCGFEYLHG